MYFFATLQNPEECLDILFLYEYCNVLTHTSKQAQDTTIPHSCHPQGNVELTFDKRLKAAHQLFELLTYPEEAVLTWTEDTDLEGKGKVFQLKSWKAWSDFQEMVENVFFF